MKRPLLVALSMITLTTSVAAADKDGFDEFVAALGSGGPAAQTWLAHCKVLLAPGGEARTPCKLTLAELSAGATGVTLEVTANKTRPLHDSQYEWRDATVEARAGAKVIATYRVVEITSMGNPDSPGGGWEPVAAHWIRLMKDKDATAAARAGKLPTPPRVVGKTIVPTGDNQDARDAAVLADELDDLRGDSFDVRGALGDWASDGTIVVGSAPAQTFTGKKGGKTIHAWKLTMKQEGESVIVTGGMLGVAVTHVTATTAGKAPVTFTYPTMIVFTQGISGGGGLISGPRLVSFSLVQ